MGETTTFQEATPGDLDSPLPASPLPVTPPRRWHEVLAGQWGVGLLAVVIGLAAWAFSLHHSLPMLYADARSHLTIARRLVDGPNASLVQLGTVWLPAPHVLTAPFTLVTSWWTSGASVLAINVTCLAIEAIALFRIVMHAAKSRLGAWVAVVALLTNPGWLYLHTTSLAEPVVFAALLGTVAGLAGWIASAKPYSGGELALFCGAPAAVAVLSRYDGWAMAGAAAVFVAVAAQMRWGQWRWTLQCVRSFSIPPAIAAIWWFWFNFVNWGDPLEFQRGPWSAQAQQDILDSAGLLPDKGSLAMSLHTFAVASLAGTGLIIAAAGVVGMVLWAATGRVKLTALAPWLLLIVPTGFYVASLYTGQIALRLGDTPDGSMFNLRYGLQVLPGLAAFTGLGVAALAGPITPTLRPVGGRTVASSVVAALLIGVNCAAWFPAWREVPVIAEGLQQRSLGAPAWGAADHLHTVLGSPEDGGGLLAIDDSVNPMLPPIGVDLDRVVAPFSGPRWDAARKNMRGVEWVFVDTAGDGDALAETARGAAFGRTFELVFSDGTISVYHRKKSS